MRRDDGCQRFEYVPTSRVRHNARNASGAALFPEFGDGTGGEFRNGPVQQVAQFTVAAFETKFVAITRLVMRVELEAAECRGSRFGPPNGSSRAIAEKTRADEDSRIVVEIEGSRAELDRDAGDRGAGLG